MTNWIKCDDHLPTPGQEVFYYFKHTGVWSGKFIEGMTINDATFASNGGFLTGDVTHWMPRESTDLLPSKPQTVVDKQIIIDAEPLFDFLKWEALEHRIIEDDHGIYRWEEDQFIRKLIDDKIINLNKLASMVPNYKNNSTIREMYRKMGYSIHGYWEIFHWEVNNPDSEQYKTYCNRPLSQILRRDNE